MTHASHFTGRTTEHPLFLPHEQRLCFASLAPHSLDPSIDLPAIFEPKQPIDLHSI